MQLYRSRERERPYRPKARNNDWLDGKLFLDGSQNVLCGPNSCQKRRSVLTPDGVFGVFDEGLDEEVAMKEQENLMHHFSIGRRCIVKVGKTYRRPEYLRA
jgi:hypothetical protein